MKKSIFTLCLAAAGMFTLTSVNAQEVKQPRVITPGNIDTRSAPSDAIVLFDGTNLDAWKNGSGDAAGWTINPDGTLTVNKAAGDIITRDNFENFQLHIEWCVPKGIEGTEQSRGNSGIFLQGQYEIQVLDSYQNDTYPYGSAGSVYNQQPPLVNAMRPNGEWNVYDILYTAPIFNEDGLYTRKPVVTVFHNGVLVQFNTEITGRTTSVGFVREYGPHGAGPIILQSHGDPSAPISYRNIWLRKL